MSSRANDLPNFDSLGAKQAHDADERAYERKHAPSRYDTNLGQSHITPEEDDRWMCNIPINDEKRNHNQRGWVGPMAKRVTVSMRNDVVSDWTPRDDELSEHNFPPPLPLVRERKYRPFSNSPSHVQDLREAVENLCGPQDSKNK